MKVNRVLSGSDHFCLMSCSGLKHNALIIQLSQMCAVHCPTHLLLLLYGLHLIKLIVNSSLFCFPLSSCPQVQYMAYVGIGGPFSVLKTLFAGVLFWFMVKFSFGRGLLTQVQYHLKKKHLIIF